MAERLGAPIESGKYNAFGSNPKPESSTTVPSRQGGGGLQPGRLYRPPAEAGWFEGGRRSLRNSDGSVGPRAVNGFVDSEPVSTQQPAESRKINAFEGNPTADIRIISL